MKIKITTDRRPWAAGRPHVKGAEIDVDADEAATLIDAGFAVAVKAEKAAPAAPETPADATAASDGDPVAPAAFAPRRRRVDVGEAG